jgi:hypothetical protein
MRRFELTDEPYQRIEHLLPGKPTDPGALSLTNIVAGSYNNVTEGVRLVSGRRMSAES